MENTANTEGRIYGLNIRHLYDEGQLVSFGNFLLKSRKEGRISPECYFDVTDADLRNWQEEQKLTV